MADSVYRYSLSHLPPRVDNENPFRRRWDIVFTQREEILNHLKFLMGLIKGDTQESFDKLDKLFNIYKKQMFPEDPSKLRREEKSLFEPWKEFFGKDLTIETIEKKSKVKKIEKAFKVKNLTKL